MRKSSTKSCRPVLIRIAAGGARKEGGAAPGFYERCEAAAEIVV